jgi:hypothetical protein
LKQGPVSDRSFPSGGGDSMPKGKKRLPRKTERRGRPLTKVLCLASLLNLVLRLLEIILKLIGVIK